MNPRPLGYEPYDVCLCDLGLPLVTLLTSVDLLREVFSDLLRLPRLSLSRRVWFTNRFTKFEPEALFLFDRPDAKGSLAPHGCAGGRGARIQKPQLEERIG